MIGGYFHQGSGLGNQLFRYITVRTVAADKGYEWGMAYRPDGSGKPAGFKGTTFMQIDQGENVDMYEYSKYMDNEMFGGLKRFEEKKVTENGVDIRSYDPEINFIQDDTLIEGEFQDERYWGHRLTDINSWLTVEPLEIPDDVCVIGFRGGEYSVFPDLFLTKDYWHEAIAMTPNKRFEVHTDDPVLAKQFFPDYPIIADIGLNWRSMRYAKHAIIANSSFYIIPRLLSKGTTIAPRYWARRNTNTWALPQNYYKDFTYV